MYSTLDVLPLLHCSLPFRSKDVSVLAAQWASAITEHHGNVVMVPGIWGVLGGISKCPAELVDRQFLWSGDVPKPQAGSRVHVQTQSGVAEVQNWGGFPSDGVDFSPFLASTSYGKEWICLKSSSVYSQRFCIMKGWWGHWVSKTHVCILIPIAQDSCYVHEVSRSLNTALPVVTVPALGYLSHPKAEPRQPPLVRASRHLTIPTVTLRCFLSYNSSGLGINSSLHSFYLGKRRKNPSAVCYCHWPVSNTRVSACWQCPSLRW